MTDITFRVNTARFCCSYKLTLKTVLLFVTGSEYLFREDKIIFITAERSPPSRFLNAAFEYKFPVSA